MVFKINEHFKIGIASYIPSRLKRVVNPRNLRAR